MFIGYLREHGLNSSHLTRAEAQARQACDTRPALGDESTRRRLLVLSWSLAWLAAWRFRRSARAKALPQTGQENLFPNVSRELHVSVGPETTAEKNTPMFSPVFRRSATTIFLNTGGRQIDRWWQAERDSRRERSLRTLTNVFEYAGRDARGVSTASCSRRTGIGFLLGSGCSGRRMGSEPCHTAAA